MRCAKRDETLDEEQAPVESFMANWGEKEMKSEEKKDEINLH